MSKKQKEVKLNKRLLNATMDKKFSLAFRAIIIGLIVVAVLALANILIYAKLANVPILTHFPRLVGLILLIGSVVLTMSMTAVVSKSLSAALVTPIHELQEAVRMMKTGEFDVDISYQSQDELGQLADDLREACAEMQAVVSDAGSVMGQLAEGKFNVTTENKECYVGEFASLLQAMEQMRGQMSETLSKIKMSSEQVMVGADQLAGSAQDLAEGATNQAGAIEELSATITNVTEISEESAKNAVMAANNATAAAKDAKKSREEMNALTEAMERITTTSQEIEDIIAAIEDIASQTNLLSLNASIEAARAGEAGRGFAVVADQIGKLAADSAQSAVSTRELISKCLVEVEDGNHIVENTMESIGEVLANMESFAGMASGAAQASKEQVDMLKQIEAGIDQITIVVQNNSATAEETSAVSQELSAQATNLEEMVGQFELSEV